MDPLMLTSVTLLARQEGWGASEPAPRPPRLRAARRRLADALRDVAVRIEPVERCEPLRPVAAP